MKERGEFPIEYVGKLEALAEAVQQLLDAEDQEEFELRWFALEEASEALYAEEEVP